MGERALDHPASGMDHKASLVGAFPDDLNDDAGGARHTLVPIGAVGIGKAHERMLLARGF